MEGEAVKRVLHNSRNTLDLGTEVNFPLFGYHHCLLSACLARLVSVSFVWVLLPLLTIYITSHMQIDFRLR